MLVKRTGKSAGIDFESIMPKVRKAEDILGTVTRKAAEETGLNPGTPVVVGGVDSAAALLELGILEQGTQEKLQETSSNNFFSGKECLRRMHVFPFFTDCGNERDTSTSFCTYKYNR